MAPRTPQKAKAAVPGVKQDSPVKGHKELSKRGTGLKFNAASYDLISRFTSETRIKYAPNPKTVGSKSFDRYAKYQNAKTVGEALKHCKPIDLLWEYERGYLQVLGGPMADKPACMNLSSEDPAIKILAKFRGPQGCSIKMDPAVRQSLETLSKEYGMDLDQLHQDAGKQCNSESADIQTSRIIADEMARRKLAAGKRIDDGDVVDVLSIWGFPENDTRQNVIPDGTKTVHSDTLGCLKMRDGTYRIFDPTTRYKHVTKLLCNWFSSNKGKEVPDDFRFTGININHNYAGKRHRDNGNEGPSAIKAIGDFTGGKLNYFPMDVKKPGRRDVAELDPKESLPLDISKQFALFNGNNAHGVQPFEGNRFSLVFFTTSKFFKIKEKEMDTLKELGFKVPDAKSTDKVKEISAKLDAARGKLL